MDDAQHLKLGNDKACELSNLSPIFDNFSKGVYDGCEKKE